MNERDTLVSHLSTARQTAGGLAGAPELLDPVDQPAGGMYAFLSPPWVRAIRGTGCAIIVDTRGVSPQVSR